MSFTWSSLCNFYQTNSSSLTFSVFRFQRVMFKRHWMLYMVIGEIFFYFCNFWDFLEWGFIFLFLVFYEYFVKTKSLYDRVLTRIGIFAWNLSFLVALTWPLSYKTNWRSILLIKISGFSFAVTLLSLSHCVNHEC